MNELIIKQGNENIYYPYEIIVKDTSRKDVLIHEMTHHLIFTRNEQLHSYVEHLIECEEFIDYFNFLVSKDVFSGYHVGNYWEEHIAYYIEDLEESELRKLNIPEYNMILDDTYLEIIKRRS